MNDFVKFSPIKANKERAEKFWEIRNQNEEKGIKEGRRCLITITR